MNSSQMAGKWNQVRGQLRNWWGKLSDDDIERIGGDKDKLIGTLQEKYGYLYEEALGEIDRRLNDFENGGDILQMGRRIKDKAREAASTVSQAMSNQTLQDLETDAVRIIRRFPVASILCGLAVGYLLGRRLER